MKKYHLMLALLALVLVGTSCRSRQRHDAHRQFHETTHAREVQQSVTATRDVQPVVGVSFREQEAASVTRQEAQQPAARQERVNVVSPIDASSLRRFSVVVASFNSRFNAESLQNRLQGIGYHVIIAQNERGMYRVIVGSFDDRASAVAQRTSLTNRHSAQGNARFGIPFNDLWILDRHF